MESGPFDDGSDGAGKGEGATTPGSVGPLESGPFDDGSDGAGKGEGAMTPGSVGPLESGPFDDGADGPLESGFLELGSLDFDVGTVGTEG